MDDDKKLEEYVGNIEDASNKIFAIFDDMDLPIDTAVDVLVSIIVKFCLIEEAPVKAAKNVSKVLTKTVKDIARSPEALKGWREILLGDGKDDEEEDEEEDDEEDEGEDKLEDER
ncbi:MAG: hypothetical protein FWH44_03070 [Methanomassiliicoccaceae archaeon]|nr:hypothetical protein [Methanomassiliicoccaceae archaeon]